MYIFITFNYFLYDKCLSIYSTCILSHSTVLLIKCEWIFLIMTCTANLSSLLFHYFSDLFPQILKFPLMTKQSSIWLLFFLSFFILLFSRLQISMQVLSNIKIPFQVLYQSHCIEEVFIIACGITRMLLQMHVTNLCHFPRQLPLQQPKNISLILRK